MKLIDKDALVAEIENLENTYKKCPTHSSYEEGLKEGRLIGYEDALHKINSLEVKEVDLQSEIDRVWDNTSDNFSVDGWKEFGDIAKHFFELGLNASNPLTWEDIKTIQNISGEVYAEVAKGKDDFYLIYPTEQSFLEKVLKRFKEQKGE